MKAVLIPTLTAAKNVDIYNGSFIEAFPVGVGSGTNAAAKIRGKFVCHLV